MTEETTFKHWQLHIDGDEIAWLTLDKAGAGVNVLSVEVIAELDRRIQELSDQPLRGIVIRSAKESGFIAGADIREFLTVRDVAEATELMRGCHTVLDRLEAFSYPTVSLIHGFCLGGGLELALACRYRIAVDDPGTRLGLPEVKLGIHPGFGGTVRLPRLIGPVQAMQLMLTGRSVSARAARRLGLVDYAVPRRQLERAAREVILHPPHPHEPGRLQRLPGHALLRPLLARYLRHSVAKRAPQAHYPAPYALIELWRKYADDPKTMLAQEAHSVAELVTGSTAQNLIRVFFLQEKMKGLGKDSDFRAAHVHVVGAGVMGGDIAAWCALRGLQVTLQDQAPERLAPALKRAHKLFRKRLRQPRLVSAAMDRLIPDIQGLGVGKADVIVEAVFENADAKRELYRSLEPCMKPGAVLATNTSSIPLEELEQALARPARLVGLHFFNPVAKMQLVEIVHGRDTDATVVAQATRFARQIDRLPLPVKSSPGFLVNRILMPYLLEAVLLESEGVPPEVIDHAAVAFGMPMGPIELADTVGLDICLSVAEILSRSLDTTVPPRLRSLVEAGRLGRKSGPGFYTYKKGKPQKTRLKHDEMPANLNDRLVLSMLNEAVACLREGVVENEDLLDGGIIFGTGFAPFRGGPIHYIRSEGAAKLRARLEALDHAHGERFAPDAGWDSLC
ncbi:MAG: 3-hydroxyacyl-CoA dehydrogenase NAD-binding domain-containing protein [Gammaproteobacteria bacterium]